MKWNETFEKNENAIRMNRVPCSDNLNSTVHNNKHEYEEAKTVVGLIIMETY